MADLGRDQIIAGVKPRMGAKEDWGFWVENPAGVAGGQHGRLAGRVQASSHLEACRASSSSERLSLLEVISEKHRPQAQTVESFARSLSQESQEESRLYRLNFPNLPFSQ
jgi:hypothetical protein